MLLGQLGALLFVVIIDTSRGVLRQNFELVQGRALEAALRRGTPGSPLSIDL